LGLDIAIVADGVADGWHDAAVALLNLCVIFESSGLRGQVADFLCAGCSGGRVVRDGGLRGPVTGCDAIDDFFGKDAVVQTKGSGWEVEVAFCWGVEGGLAWGPMDVVEWRSGDTESFVAEVVVARRLCEEGAVVWFGRTADEAR
jgi:hypothetical protein